MPSSQPADAFPSLDLFRDRLNLAMQRADLNQSELGRAIGATPQAVSRMTRHEGTAYGGRNITRLAEALRVPAAWLAYNEFGVGPENFVVPKPAEVPTAFLGLSALQYAGLEALATLMRGGEFGDGEVIDLLAELKPRLATLKSKADF